MKQKPNRRRRLENKCLNQAVHYIYTPVNIPSPGGRHYIRILSLLGVQTDLHMKRVPVRVQSRLHRQARLLSGHEALYI